MSPPSEAQAEAQAEPKTEIDHQIGQPTFAINFIARPAGAFGETITEIQQALAADLPEGVYTCPVESLHLTIASLVWARGAYAFDVRQWWASNAAAAIGVVTGLAREPHPVILAVDGFDVFPGAMVVRFACSPIIEAMRQKIAETEIFHEGTVNIPDFTHLTLFRYEAVLPLSEITQVVDRHSFPDVNWDIDHLILCQEEIYPSLSYTDIATVPLPG